MLILCNYYVTYRCNAFCNFCHFGDHNAFKNTPRAKFEDFASNIVQLKSLGVRFIDLTGGEPLLHPQIAEMAKLARGYKMRTSITTNCLLYPKYAESLAGHVNLLHFSLDSPDKDEHDKIRGVNCFESVLKSISIAKKLGEFPDILFTVTNETYQKLPEMYELSKKHEVVLIVNPVFSYFGNPGLHDDAINFIRAFVKGKSSIYLNDSYLQLRKDGGNHIAKPACKAVTRVIVISPSNEIILPCYHFSNEKVLIDRPIKELRSSEKIQSFQKMEGRFSFCEGCTVNCYFEPSFAFPVTSYAVRSIPSKLRYGYHKLIKQKIQKSFSSEKTDPDNA